MSASCDRCAEIGLAEAEGKMLANSDLAFRQDHEASCPACRAEASALSLLSMPAGSPAHFKASATERARLLDAVLLGVDSPDAPAEVEREPEVVDNVVPFARRIRRTATWAAGVMAVAAAVALMVRVGPVAIRSSPQPTARVLLASGNGLSAGMTAAEGQDLSAVGGETSLALGSDIIILLDPGSKARLVRLQASGIEVALMSGRVHASVKPNTPGPRLAVLTREGRVEVTGTLFSVEARDGLSELRVLRGSVKVSAPGHKVSHVEAMQGQRLGTDEIHPMAAAEQERELAAMRRISLLETAEAATLHVRSEPLGAKVFLDGEVIGITPLSAEVKTGHRHLVVSNADRSHEEWIDLYAGKDAPIHNYDLSVQVAVVQPVHEPAREIHHNAPVVAPVAPAPKLSAEDLLKRAQVLRSQKDFAGSAAAYRELTESNPAFSPAAWVSYGEILGTNLGDQEGSLKACETYLARNDWLGQAAEASACRIHALRALGRTDEEKAAIQKFIDSYPASVQVGQMKKRLEELH